MPSFRAERDMRFDLYFSADILEALTKVDETDLGLASGSGDERADFYRQGFQMAIGRLAGLFGFSYFPLGTPRQAALERAIE